MSNHIHGMTQKYDGSHYTPHILPIKPKRKPVRKTYIPRVMRPYMKVEQAS